MPKKIELKTSKNEKNPREYIESIEKEQLKADCLELLDLFEKVTGMEAKMWGDSIVGFGEYKYYRSNGDEGDFMATGFAPRSTGPTLYIMPGYSDYSHLLDKLGPHRLGKSCLYLRNLMKIDRDVLSELIQTGLKDLKEKHETNY